MALPEPQVAVPSGDAREGARVFKEKCRQCHTIHKGGGIKQGPPLWGFFGKECGRTGFAYSEANKNSGIVWTEKHLWEYLLDPRAYMPGTKMVMPGVRPETERADLIAYLREAAAREPETATVSDSLQLEHGRTPSTSSGSEASA
uniref:Cytochrome c domain-containing protein n=1 Tax=Chromera velia CCMP2878 TaxID=1169474 RepID=A0A0G4GBC8_9ALVE|eukprot:Cvel_4463.t1-p1 / transcript=Cvel_4463.t1 / gene=Cvel_4463 / organism=Chromera_velia_CCMP2878 / gene_product=Cytochrome c, putative / transcript_product=Cytochrome c, putative / location=Cvel_scaffold195:38564-40489(-) / protein_length=144 / sequence_SO=supercontig / SO=protein_coding / is_pseudo=false